eukprot:TRINITY_DN4892_c0_g1_i2.p1 TRINITY_DN4892_c0_g1~~TRINITY_DN4892_c0_g1_i2.p1  ORF type:complete len:189 (-),score=11.59 TRINITY_DN4892_c0_g1_i2:65-631(-)
MVSAYALEKRGIDLDMGADEGHMSSTWRFYLHPEQCGGIVAVPSMPSHMPSSPPIAPTHTQPMTSTSPAHHTTPPAELLDDPAFADLPEGEASMFPYAWTTGWLQFYGCTLLFGMEVLGGHENITPGWFDCFMGFWLLNGFWIFMPFVACHFMSDLRSASSYAPPRSWINALRCAVRPSADQPRPKAQ